MDIKDNIEIEQYIDRLLDRKQVLGRERETEKQRLFNELNDLVLRAVIKALSDDKLAELNHVLDEDEMSEEQIDKVVNDSGVDMTEVTRTVLIKFENEYSGGKQDA